MSRRGLTREGIIDAAQELLEERGLPEFSLRALAATLDVQVSSLYNHISGQSELIGEVGRRAAAMLASAERSAIDGLSGDEALYSLAWAYHAFALDHPELYRLVMGAHSLCLPAMESLTAEIAEPIFRVLSDYGVRGDRLVHYQRTLRSIMHGFFAHEHHGSFSGAGTDREKSYNFAVECIALRLNSERAEGEQRQ